MKPGLFLWLTLVIYAFAGLLIGLGITALQDSFFIMVVVGIMCNFAVRAWALAHAREYCIVIPGWLLWLVTFMAFFGVPIYLFRVHGFLRGCWANIKAFSFLLLAGCVSLAVTHVSAVASLPPTY